MKKIIILSVTIVAVYAVSLLIPSCMNQQEKAKNIAVLDSVAVVDSILNTKTTSTITEHNGWDYDSVSDEMTDAPIYFADLISDNIAYFDFPYEGGTNAKLSVRKHPKYGTDVMFMISQGQLLCNDYDGTNYVTVRFDNAPAERYYTNEPSDMSSEMLFLRNSKRFIAKAKNAKKIRIQAPVYNNGNVVFIFTTDDALKWNH